MSQASSRTPHALAGERRPFVVLEGVEGSGKSTQCRLLGEWLRELGIPHLVTREPGGTTAGEEIRKVVLHGDDIPARTELLLMLAARSIFVDQVVQPALGDGLLVIADRFELSTLAYQAYGRGLAAEVVQRMNAFATAGLSPDLTIVLDVEPAAGAARRAAAGAAADRIERAGEEFHARVAGAYRLLAKELPNVELVDGSGDTQQVQQRLRSLLGARFGETFRAISG